MSGVTEEELYKKLKGNTNPNIRDIELYYQNGKLYLVEKLIADKDLDDELKGKLKKLVRDIPYYQRLKEIAIPTNETILEAEQDNKLYLIAELEVESDIDVKIRKRWSSLLGNFLKQYEAEKKVDQIRDE
jgi:hypothetical protein